MIVLQNVVGLNSSATYLVTLAESASISMSSAMVSMTAQTVQMKLDATMVSNRLLEQ